MARGTGWAAPEPALEREGVAAVTFAFARELHWLPRDLPTSDFGIDMHVETVQDSRPTGRLIALQVKSGTSYFSEPTADGWVFRDSDHLDYWTKYSLPVIVVLYDPSTKTCYWQAVRPSTVAETRSGWKMTVPRDQKIDGASEAALTELAGGDPYLNRVALLRADLDLIRAAARGDPVQVEVEEWVNKLSGRGTIRVAVESGSGIEVLRSWNFMAGGWSYEELLPALFPWADLVVSEEIYDEHDRAQWDLETGAWDAEEGRYVLHSVDYDEWAAAQDSESRLRPYTDNGEVAFWTLEARLGKIGAAFLDLDDFLTSGEHSPRS